MTQDTPLSVWSGIVYYSECRANASLTRSTLTLLPTQAIYKSPVQGAKLEDLIYRWKRDQEVRRGNLVQHRSKSFQLTSDAFVEVLVVHEGTHTMPKGKAAISSRAPAELAEYLKQLVTRMEERDGRLEASIKDWRRGGYYGRGFLTKEEAEQLYCTVMPRAEGDLTCLDFAQESDVPDTLLHSSESDNKKMSNY